MWHGLDLKAIFSKAQKIITEFCTQKKNIFFLTITKMGDDSFNDEYAQLSIMCPIQFHVPYSFVCLSGCILSWYKVLFSIYPTEKRLNIWSSNQTYHLPIFFSFHFLNNNLSCAVLLLLYSSFVHHKSLRYELNHLIAIIRLSQFVIGTDGRTRIFLVNVDVVNFNVSFYFYLIFCWENKN